MEGETADQRISRIVLQLRSTLVTTIRMNDDGLFAILQVLLWYEFHFLHVVSRQSTM
jgi:hypothetical protein